MQRVDGQSVPRISVARLAVVVDEKHMWVYRHAKGECHVRKRKFGHLRLASGMQQEIDGGPNGRETKGMEEREKGHEQEVQWSF